jgi:nitrogen fixation protein FixH
MASMGKTTTELKPQGSGRYEGAGNLAMAGSWQVTVTARQGANTLATKTFNLVAKE